MSSPSSIHRDIADCWNRRDYDGLRSMAHREYTYTGGDGKEMAGGPETAVRVSRMWAEAFPDGKLEIRNVYTQGNVSIAEMIGRGTHNGNFMGMPPTGKHVEVNVCTVFELRDGKVYRERQYLDMHHIMEQIGGASQPQRAARA